MSRAIFLPFPGDPFLLTLWLRSYHSFFKDEIDRLYIHFNSPIEKEVREYIYSLTDKPGITLLERDDQIQHGDAINEMLNICSEDYVGLVEDDGIIYRKGIIRDQFYLLEANHFDVIGSQRGSCSPEILERAKSILGVRPDMFGNQECNFWPCYFFTRREILEKTDRNFNAKSWKFGDTVPGINYSPDFEVVGDTFVNTSLQIRSLHGVNIGYVDQNHCNVYDWEERTKGANLRYERNSWLHVGSLSSGVGGVLTDDNYRPLARRKLLEPQNHENYLRNKPNTDMEVAEWERRVCWWSIALDFTVEMGLDAEIKQFTEEYANALARVVREFGLRNKRINFMKTYYKGIIKL